MPFNTKNKGYKNCEGAIGPCPPPPCGTILITMEGRARNTSNMAMKDEDPILDQCMRSEYIRNFSKFFFIIFFENAY